MKKREPKNGGAQETVGVKNGHVQLAEDMRRRTVGQNCRRVAQEVQQ